MGLFTKKSDEEKITEKMIEDLCGGFLSNEKFKSFLKKNYLDETTSNLYYKKILKNEIKNGTLNYDNLESRLDELMKLDVDALENKIRMSHKQDTSLFKTQQDIIDYLGAEYAEKYYKALDKKLKKQSKKAGNETEKIRKLEEKFNIDLMGKTWFQCSIEEVKYSTFSNQPQRNFDTAYIIVNEDNFEIFKESVWIKSNMGSRKLFFNNIASMDYDARGVFHASTSVIINTKSAEHVQLKFVSREKFDLMNNAFESYLNKSHSHQQTSPQQNISVASPADELLKYAELYEKGLLTKEEFEMKKSELLGFNAVEVKPDGNVSLEQDSIEDAGADESELKPQFCGECGASIDYDGNFCPNCGAKLIKF